MLKVKYNPFTRWVKERIAKNKNAIGVFLGQTGSGKTYGALDFSLDLAKEIGTDFTIENNMAFDFKTMLIKMNLSCNQNKGTVFLLEEVGAVGSGGASSEWMSKANAFFSSFLQTSRHRNQILIFTTPNFSLLTKQARQLIHFNIVMKMINPANNTSKGVFKICQTNPISGKTYMKYLRRRINNQVVKFPNIIFKLPHKDILVEYEREKLKYTSLLNKQIIDVLNDKEDYSLDKAQIKQLELYEEQEAYRLQQDGLIVEDIAKKLNLSKATVDRRLRTYKGRIRLNASNITQPRHNLILEGYFGNQKNI